MVRVFKMFQALLIASAIFLSLPATATATAPERTLFPGGGDHPWPWSLALPFPWDDIQGVWTLDVNNKTIYYSIRRLQAKRLVINQFDLSTCNVVASGPGLERANTVVAQMSQPSTRQVYRVTLYAFDPKDSPEPPKMNGRFDPGPIMVARINPLSSPGPEIASQLVKISSRLDIRCSRMNKILKF